MNHVCFSEASLNCRIAPRIAQWYSARLRAGWSGVRFPGGAGNFSLHHRVQTGSGAHPASYPVDCRGSFPGVKRPEREANSPPSSAEVKEWVELYFHYPSTPSWRRARLKAQGRLYLYFLRMQVWKSANCLHPKTSTKNVSALYVISVCRSEWEVKVWDKWTVEVYCIVRGNVA
jgi:hypothetical protein